MIKGKLNANLLLLLTQVSVAICIPINSSMYFQTALCKWITFLHYNYLRIVQGDPRLLSFLALSKFSLEDFDSHHFRLQVVSYFSFCTCMLIRSTFNIDSEQYTINSSAPSMLTPKFSSFIR